MAEYCDTPQSKERSNREYKVCLRKRSILRLLDQGFREKLWHFDAHEKSLLDQYSLSFCKGFAMHIRYEIGRYAVVRWSLDKRRVTLMPMMSWSVVKRRSNVAAKWVLPASLLDAPIISILGNLIVSSFSVMLSFYWFSGWSFEGLLPFSASLSCPYSTTDSAMNIDIALVFERTDVMVQGPYPPIPKVSSLKTDATRPHPLVPWHFLSTSILRDPDGRCGHFWLKSYRDVMPITARHGVTQWNV